LLTHPRFVRIIAKSHTYRSKIDFTLDSVDDSDEWSEEDYGGTSSKKKTKVLEPEGSFKSRPKRASTLKRKCLAEIESEEEF
jgi:hypothetical protein